MLEMVWRLGRRLIENNLKENVLCRPQIKLVYGELFKNSIKNNNENNVRFFSISSTGHLQEYFFNIFEKIEVVYIGVNE